MRRLFVFQEFWRGSAGPELLKDEKQKARLPEETGLLLQSGDQL
jgi:hypothetical protein